MNITRVLYFILLVFSMWADAVMSSAEILQCNDLAKLETVIKDPFAHRSQVFSAIARLEALAMQYPEAWMTLGEVYRGNQYVRDGLQTLSEEERRNRVLTYYLRASHSADEANMRLAEFVKECGQRETAWLFYIRAATQGNKNALTRLRDCIPYIEGEEFKNYVHAVCGDHVSLPARTGTGVRDDIDSFFSAIDQTATANVSMRGLHQLYENLRASSMQRTIKWEAEEALKPQPSSEEQVRNQNIAIRFSLLGLLGIIFALCKRLYLYANYGDICLTLLLTALFIAALFYQDAAHSVTPPMRFVALGLILIALVPLSLKANPGMAWALILVIPAKMLISALTLFSAFASFAYSSSAFDSKRDRGKNIAFAIFYGAATFFLHKFMKSTTLDNHGQR